MKKIELNFKYNFIYKSAHKDFVDPLIDFIDRLEAKGKITPHMKWVRDERIKKYMVVPLPQYVIE